MSFQPKMSFFEDETFGRKSFLKNQVFSSLFPFSKKIVGDLFRLYFYNPVKINTRQWAILVFHEKVQKTKKIVRKSADFS